MQKKAFNKQHYPEINTFDPVVSLPKLIKSID